MFNEIETPTTINMPRIGDPAPSFTAVTTQGNIHFPNDYQGKSFSLAIQPTLRQCALLNL
jgi:peroxiredoxin 2/4